MYQVESLGEMQRIRLQTASAEEAEFLVSSTYSPVKIRPVSRQPYDLEAHVLRSGGVGYTKASSSSGSLYQFGNPYDGYGLTIPVSGNFELQAVGGERILTASVQSTITDSSRIVQACFNPGSAWRRIAIDSRDVHQRVGDLTGKHVRGRIRFSPIVPSKEPVLRLLLTLLDTLFDGVANDGPLLHAPAALASLRDTTLCALVEGLHHDHAMNLQGRFSGLAPRQVTRAVDFIHANARLPLELKDIAESVGVNPRTLQLNFKKFRDVTPMEYLRTVRLQGARAELLSCPPGTKVATIAYGWGFAHMGLFSAQFRKAFGENPSSILRRVSRS